MKRPSIFGLMLIAFFTVIVLSLCGTGTVFVLSARLNQPEGSGIGRPPWMTDGSDANSPLEPTDVGAPPAATPYNNFRSGFDWRVPLSTLLAFCAILLGAATFFSSRVARPLTRLTRAALQMADGDLSVRVKGSAVREVADLAGAFNSMAVALSDADRQRRQMTADVAHELRTPLAIIRGLLEGMQDGIYTATPEKITGLLNETALLERLIEDLRVLALVDAGALPLYTESIAPAALLRSVAHSFIQQAQEQGVKLRVADLPSLPEVEADPQRIAQVLGNLVANSLRHTPAGGAITLEARIGAPDSWAGRVMLCLAVRDTGSGIAPDDLPHIFDRFYRADHARTRAAGGAGLGLAIAKRLIEAHHGLIWAESSPGQGTAISFALPLPQDSL